MFMMISLERLTLACPFLPLYRVKPPRAPKLIAVWQIFSCGVDFLRGKRRIHCGFKNIRIGFSNRIGALPAAHWIAQLLEISWLSRKSRKWLTVPGPCSPMRRTIADRAASSSTSLAFRCRRVTSQLWSWERLWKQGRRAKRAIGDGNA